VRLERAETWLLGVPLEVEAQGGREPGQADLEMVHSIPHCLESVRSAELAGARVDSQSFLRRFEGNAGLLEGY